MKLSEALLFANCASLENARNVKKENAKFVREPQDAETSQRPLLTQPSRILVPKVTAKFVFKELRSMLQATSELKKLARSALKETAKSVSEKTANLVRKSSTVRLSASRKTRLLTVILNLIHVKEATAWSAARKEFPLCARFARMEAAESASKVNAQLVLLQENVSTATIRVSAHHSQNHCQHSLQLFAVRENLA